MLRRCYADVTLHPTPYTLHSTPYTLHLTLYTLHLTPNTFHLSPFSFQKATRTHPYTLASTVDPDLYAYHEDGANSVYVFVRSILTEKHQ